MSRGGDNLLIRFAARRRSSPHTGSVAEESTKGHDHPSYSVAQEKRPWTQTSRWSGHAVPRLLRKKLIGRSRMQQMLLLIALFLISTFFYQTRSIGTRRFVKRIDQHALDIWTDYVTTHPAFPDDRYGLREMGFRSFVYAELLRRNRVDVLPSLDNSLWSFAQAPIITPDLDRSHHLFTDTLSSAAKSLPRPGIFSRRKKGDVSHSGYLTSAEDHQDRGIVMIVTLKTAETVLAQVEAIQSVLGSSLPFELYFYGRAEVPRSLQRIFETLPNVRVVDLMSSDLFDEEILHHEDLSINPRLARQALALVSTRFRQVIYMEPEAVFLQDPAVLFDTPQYQSTGTLFFRKAQLWPASGGRRLLNLLRRQLDRASPSVGLANSPFYNFEVDEYATSGVSVFDRRRPGVVAALLYNAWFHAAAQRERLWHLHYRDAMRELLWLSFEMSQIPYSFVDAAPGAIGFAKVENILDPLVCSPRPLHFHNATRGGPEGNAQPLWFEDSLALDERREAFLHPTAWNRRGKWVPYDGQWCVAGSDAILIDSEESEEVSQTLKHLIAMATRSAVRYREMLSFVKE